MTIILGADHAGFALRRILANYLFDRGYAISEVGASGEDAFDYPDAAIEVAERVASKNAEFGILVCGTGIGMSITANKFPGIRAAVCWNEESAKLSREHNDANILCLGARLIAPDDAIKILDAFLNQQASEEPRHKRRIEKINSLGLSNKENAIC